jgi:hypothetical protein
MLRWILLLVCFGVGWAGAWPFYLGIAAAHGGLDFSVYGPLLALGIILFLGACFVAVRVQRWPH